VVKNDSSGSGGGSSSSSRWQLLQLLLMMIIIIICLCPLQSRPESSGVTGQWHTLHNKGEQQQQQL